MEPRRGDQTTDSGAAKRQRSPSYERRQQRRSIERVEVATLTAELQDAYNRKRARR